VPIADQPLDGVDGALRAFDDDATLVVGVPSRPRVSVARLSDAGADRAGHLALPSSSASILLPDVTVRAARGEQADDRRFGRAAPDDGSNGFFLPPPREFEPRPSRSRPSTPLAQRRRQKERVAVVVGAVLFVAVVLAGQSPRALSPLRRAAHWVQQFGASPRAVQ
jgi:hypothetical protein